MTMPALSRTEEVLYASEATLRLVDREMQELGHQPAANTSLPSISFEDAPRVLDRANQQIISLLSHLRRASAVQQPSHDAALLVEVESRLVEVARLFDPQAEAQLAPADPIASANDTESRRALVGEIFPPMTRPAA
jgi:hypothetical protein